MPKTLFEAGIADLEKTAASPAILVAKAAALIGADLEENLHRCLSEVRYTGQADTHGLKEQWLLRWLLKKLSLSATQESGGGIQASSDSFLLSAYAWSLLLHLTCSIPRHACLEILQDRKFYHTLDQSLRFLNGTLTIEHQSSTSVDSSPAIDGPPSKKRRIEPRSSVPESADVRPEALVFIILQCACRCLDLLHPTYETQHVQSHHLTSAWNSNWSDRASLFGALVESVAAITDPSLHSEELSVLSSIVATIVAFWTTGSANARGHNDDPDSAFSQRALMPVLQLITVLNRRGLERKSTGPLIRSLDRLVVVHVVLPSRKLFNERHAKKWRAANDVLHFENLKGFLTDFEKTIIGLDQARSWVENRNSTYANLNLLSMVFDLAIRSIPPADVRRRQSEQPWLDAIFISLSHILWNVMPRISASGVTRPASASVSGSDDLTTIPPVEILADIALSAKVRMSLPVLGYALSALLASDDVSRLWSALAKLVQLDVNILIPGIGLSTSKDILNRLCGLMEETITSDVLFSRILNEIILPMMRASARTRNLDDFISVWQDGLQNAIRQRYSSQSGSETISTVLVWEEDDVFAEFKILLELYASPSLCQNLVENVADPLRSLETKVGSTAAEFANLAILCSYLQASEALPEDLRIRSDQCLALLKAAIVALRRTSDYQGQRWRLWMLIRLLLQQAIPQDLIPSPETFLHSEGGFVSLQTLCSDDKTDHSRQRPATTYLEALECFSIVVDVARKSPAPNRISFLRDEMSYLSKLLAKALNQHRARNSGDEISWDGRLYTCVGAERLLIACIGRLLASPEVFSLEANIFADLISQALACSNHSSLKEETQGASLTTSLRTLLQTDEVIDNEGLQDLVSTHILKSLSSSPSAVANERVLLHHLQLHSLKRTHAKRLATTVVQNLNSREPDTDDDKINDHLAILLYLDGHLPGSATDVQEWRNWVNMSQKLAVQGRMCSSFLLRTSLLLRILRRLWARIFHLSKSPLLHDLASWLKDSVTKSKPVRFTECPDLAVQAFFAQVAQTKSSLEDHLSTKKLQKLRAKFMIMLVRNLKAALDGSQPENLMSVRLTLCAMVDTWDPSLGQEVLEQNRHLQEIISTRKSSDSGQPAAPFDTRILLSVIKAYGKLNLSSNTVLSDDAISSLLNDWAANIGESDDCSTEAIGLVATQLDLIVSRLNPASKGNFLQQLRAGKLLDGSPILGPIAIAIALARIDESQLSEYPVLIDELADVACGVAASSGQSVKKISLLLGNCKTVLEKYPSVINQSTLDRLLAALNAITSSPNKILDIAHQDSASEASDLYARICDVLGVVLGRHRRRLSDRYHLLVPALQNLLRCLFWPGSDLLSRMSGTDAANTLHMFGRALPQWMIKSETPLPQTSAEQLGRLLSSICNPTVAAARASRQRGRNELNDEIKKARHLAGQHMLYFIMEYARCSLDGQIEPSVKEHLMPGMYAVMDAIDRDLMRALNSGMDPSSRAIFKNLYDDWTRFGRWDKS